MDDKEKMSLLIYNAILSVRDTLSLPTHKTIEKTLIYSVVLLVCSALSTLLRFYTFVSWQGALLCTLLLVLLLWIERRENDALLRMYRTAELSAKKAMRRAKDAGNGHSSRRGSTNSNSSQQKTTKRRVQRNNESE